MPHKPMAPEHEFSKYKKRDQWEKVVIENATEFVVIKPGVVKRWDRSVYPTFSAARKDAATSDRSMLYAVTPRGREALVPTEQWDRWEEFFAGKV